MREHKNTTRAFYRSNALLASISENRRYLIRFAPCFISYTFNKNEGSTEFQPFILPNGYKAYNNDRCYELQEGQGFGLGFMV